MYRLVAGMLIMNVDFWYVGFWLAIKPLSYMLEVGARFLVDECAVPPGLCRSRVATCGVKQRVQSTSLHMQLHTLMATNSSACPGNDAR